MSLETDEDANDLDKGDSVVDGRSARCRATGRRKRKSGRRGAFEVEAVVGKVIADGHTAYANKGVANAGVVLYCTVRRDYSPDMMWYEPAEHLGSLRTGQAV
eukprot:6176141-Pleurochrysis_carterae.AAC.1